MLRLLIDTCVWLDIAKDYRHRPTLHALESRVENGDVELILPRQVVDEFATRSASSGRAAKASPARSSG